MYLTAHHLFIFIAALAFVSCALATKNRRVILNLGLVFLGYTCLSIICYKIDARMNFETSIGLANLFSLLIFLGSATGAFVFFEKKTAYLERHPSRRI